MKGTLNTDNYHYQVNQLHRDDVMRAAEQQRLAHPETDAPSSVRRSFVARLIERLTHVLSKPLITRRGLRRLVFHRHVMKGLAVAFIVVSLLTVTGVSHAQADLNDPGQPIQYPERVHYFVGMYFYERENYARAIDEFTLTIERLPQMGDAYAARADSYAALQQYDLAIVDYTRALELNAEDPLVDAKRAVVIATLSELEAARVAVTHGVEPALASAS